MKSFTKKLLIFTISMAAPGYPAGGGAGVTFTTPPGLRATAKIVKAGGRSAGVMQAAIYGLTLEHMNALTTFGTQLNLTSKSKVVVQAGDREQGMTARA